MRLPRYFVPHATSPAEPLVLDPSALVHAVDAFRLLDAAGGEHEWLVCTDITGELVCLPAEERERLPPGTRAQFTHHELVSGRPPRRLLASAVFLLSVELVEHPADAQGVNDPVYLYGRLAGPWPGDAQRIPGQLTVTRGDLLAGLVHGAPDSLHYAHDPESRLPPRAWHALLPGDRPEQLARGEGLVLAYPSVPLDLQTHNAGNGPVVAPLLHEVLETLQAAARAHGGPGFLADMALPVPSRRMAIAELESRGYEVKGDVATPRPQAAGLVHRLAGWLRAEKLTVPPEAGTPEFLELARRALDVLPGWPSETERTLRARVRAGTGPSASTPAPVRIPVAPAGPAPSAAPLPPRAPPAPARPSDWMQDFLDAHARPDGTPPRVTRSRAATPKSEQASKPDWMSDFED